MSIGYATATRGGSHHDTRPTLQYATDHDNTTLRANLNSPSRTSILPPWRCLTQCRFVSETWFWWHAERQLPPSDQCSHWVEALLADVERIGERIWNLERAFNVREGVRRSQTFYLIV